jgi:putative MATE family efflux protein
VPDHSTAQPRNDTVRLVVRLAAPAIAQQLLHTLVFLIDRAMLGRHAAASLASMQISGPVVWTSVSLLSAVTVGTVALVGRAVGAGDRELASAAARGSLLFAVAVGIVVSVLGLLALPGLLLLFPAAGEEVRAAAEGYLSVFLPTMPFFLLSFTSAAILTAAGDTKTPFLVAAAGNVINVALNWFLIFGNQGAPELGVQGAAVGSAAAMAFQALVLVSFLARRSAIVTFRGGAEWRGALRRMLRVSAPSAAERAVQQAGFLGFVMMIGALGATAMAANQALVSIEAICFLSADGFGVAAAAVVAQRLGGRRPDDAALAGRAATLFAAAALTAYGLVVLVMPAALLGIFTDDRAIVEAGLPVMLVLAAAQPFMATGIVLSQALRGAGETRAPFVVMVAGGLVIRLVATWLFAFPLGLGLVGVWIGSTVDWVVRAVLLGWVFWRGGWRDVTI